MTNNYWETETPVTFENERFNVLWYPEAKQLCIDRNAWTRMNGEEMKTRHLNVNIRYLANLPVDQRKDLEAILSEVLELIRSE